MTELAPATPSFGLERVRRARPNLLVRTAKLARRKPLGAFSAIIILTMLVAAAFSPIIAPYEPQVLTDVRLIPPSIWPFSPSDASPDGVRYVFGTDEIGRDLFSRIVYGSRISLYVGFMAVLSATGIGATLGTISGYLGGKFDMLFQRVMDAFQALPALVLALTIVSVLGSSINNVVIAIAVVIIPQQARVIRGAVLSVKEEVYVDAARAVGCKTGRILVRHIAPNVMAPIIVLASLLFGFAIIVEATLSFLGLGPPPPTPTWGGMLQGPARNFMERQFTLALFPGLAIAFAVIAFNLMGDTLRDLLDPRLRGR